MQHVDNQNCKLKIVQGSGIKKETTKENKTSRVDIKTLMGRDFEDKKVMRLSKEIDIFEELQIFWMNDEISML